MPFDPRCQQLHVFNEAIPVGVRQGGQNLFLHSINQRQQLGVKLPAAIGQADNAGAAILLASAWDSLAPTYEVDDTDYGYRYVAFRAMPGRDDARHARQVPAILPCMRFIPGHTDFAIALMDVPMTDTETATYQIAYSHNEPITREWSKAFLGFNGDRYDEDTCAVTMSWPHDMGQDRAAMKGGSWSGFAAIEFEDVAMAMSLNDPYDRSAETLVAADIAVTRLRQTLYKAVKAHEADGTAPGADRADMTGVIAYDRVVLNSEDWKAI